MTTIEEPEFARSDSSISRIEKRARRQRGCFLVMSLWVLGWSSLFINGLIQYNEWLAPLWGLAVFTLVVSPFTLIYTLPLSLIGYWIGGIPIWKSYRYHWTLALPIAAAVTIQVPTTLDRLQPERRFHSLTSVELPSHIRITNYRSCFAGIDGSVYFDLSIPTRKLDSFYAEMAKDSPDAPAIIPLKDHITHDLDGAMIEVSVDRTAGTMNVSYLRY